MNSILRKNKILVAFVVVSFLILPFYVSSSAGESSLSSLKVVQDGTGPGFSTSDLTFLTYFGSNPLVSGPEYLTLLTSFRRTFAIEQNVTDFRKNTGTNIYIAFSPQVNISSQFALEIREEIMENGKGLFYIVGANENATSVANKFFNDFFGYPIVNLNSKLVTTEEISTTKNYTVINDFTSPPSPVFADITKLYYNGTSLSINNTALEEFSNQENPIARIKDNYALMKSKNLNLAYAFEFGGLSGIANKGRIVILPSANMLSEEVIGPGATIPIQGYQNDLFGLNIAKWVGRASGYFKLTDSNVNIPSGSTIYPDAIIESNFTIQDDLGDNFTDGLVKVTLESANLPYITNYAESLGNGSYMSSMKVNQLPTQRSYKITIVVTQKGYLEQSFTLATQIFVSPFLSSWSLPNPMILLTLIIGIVIYSTNVVLLWTKFRKVE